MSVWCPGKAQGARSPVGVYAMVWGGAAGHCALMNVGARFKGGIVKCAHAARGVCSVWTRR
jgi:hypothetical protein